MGPGHACHVTCPQPVARSYPQVDSEKNYEAGTRKGMSKCSGGGLGFGPSHPKWERGGSRGPRGCLGLPIAPHPPNLAYTYKNTENTRKHTNTTQTKAQPIGAQKQKNTTCRIGASKQSGQGGANVPTHENSDTFGMCQVAPSKKTHNRKPVTQRSTPLPKTQAKQKKDNA